ncbi:unnamed protein product [Sphagnum jensenii]|uniref:Uncharacterized protein n=1 Tax=Sphagnum jensenii TaxID=128206 RepID=A0ABP1B1P4_9BRYO
MLLMLLLVSYCADSTVLQSLGRTTRAIETQHQARLGNHTKQSIHSATTTNPPNNQGALMARVHKLLRIPISLFFLRYFLDIGIMQQLLDSTSFLQSLKSPKSQASILLFFFFFFFFPRCFLNFTTVQHPLYSTSFPNAPKIPNPLASYLLLLLLQVYFKTFLQCDSC